MQSSVSESTIIGAAAFAVVPIDGSRGACLFGAVAAALGDGTSASVLRQTVATAARRHAVAIVQFRNELHRVGELTELAGSTMSTE